MRRLLAAAGLAGLGFMTCVAVAGPAGAASRGCAGTATSFDDSGKQLDKASRSPDAGGTSDHPFEVDTDGHVKYTYDAGKDIAGGSWHLTLLGVKTIGDDISDTASASGGGDEPLKSHLEV